MDEELDLLLLLCNLVHGWDSMKKEQFYSLLGLSTHKNVKCSPTMTKQHLRGSLATGLFVVLRA